MDVELPRLGEPMMPNPTVENISPSLKRKAPHDDLKKGKSKADNAEKKPKVEASPAKPRPLVELKGRKLIFNQESASRPIPRRRLLALETYLLDLEDAKQPLKEIPEQFWDVIAMSGHELTSGIESLFVKHLKTAMDATKTAPERIPNQILLPLVPKLFTLRQYGFQSSDFPHSNYKLPAALQIRCWEVVDIPKYFPEDLVESVLARRKERETAREMVLGILNGMDDIEKMELIKGEKDKKSEKEVKAEVEKERPATPIIGFPEARTSREGTANTESSRRSASPTKKAKMTPEEEEAARVKKEEREAKKALVEAKKAATAEKQAAKEKEEEKKKSLLAKQTAMFSSFLVPKTKTRIAPTLISQNSEAGPSSPIKSDMSDFDKTFKPFVKRPNVEWAPINRWSSGSAGPSTSEFERWAREGETSVNGWQRSEFVRDHLRRHNIPPMEPRSGIKIDPQSVQDLWVEYQTAAEPRKIADMLKDRSRFPWKTLAFDLQARPPYSGTFTKKSSVVGPRTPFAQDPIFDYSYDSGDDWEDEGGEDVDDLDEVVDEDESESEGEFDDWLDDSDDVEVKVQDARLDMKVVKKRDVPKKVVKVIPYWRGPVWESVLGEGVEGLENYRIQLLNDTPVSIDPFAYTSSTPAQLFKPTFSDTAIGTNIGVKCLIASEPISKPPPPRITGPKLFPSTHLQDFLKLIEGSTKTRIDLVSELKAAFEGVITKAAIEAKIKEVAVREGKAKDSKWKVKPEAWC